MKTYSEQLLQLDKTQQPTKDMYTFLSRLGNYTDIPTLLISPGDPQFVLYPLINKIAGGGKLLCYVVVLAGNFPYL